MSVSAPDAVMMKPERRSTRHSLADRRSSCYTLDRQSWGTAWSGKTVSGAVDALETALQNEALSRHLELKRERLAKTTQLEEGLAVNFLYDMGTELVEVCIYFDALPEPNMATRHSYSCHGMHL